MSTTEDLQLLLDAGVGTAVAPRLLRELGGIAGIAGATAVELKQHGLTSKAAFRFAAALRIGRSIVLLRSPAILHPENIFQTCAPRLAGLQQEVFLVVSLDVRNQLIDVSEVARGSVHAVEVHPREVFRTAIRVAAAGIVLVHNHPAGNPEPSEEDVDLTCRMYKVGEMIGVPVIDHLVIAGDKFRSIREYRGSVFA